MRFVSSFTAGHSTSFVAGFIAALVCLIAFGVAQAQPVAVENEPAQSATAQTELAPTEPATTEPALTEPALTELAPTEQMGTDQEGGEPRYRVELLIFRHLGATEEGFTETELRDFSSALDLLTPPEPAPEGDALPKTVEPSKPHATEGSPGIEAGVASEGGAEAELEPPIELVEQQSEAMQHAWRRLRGSAGFRPEQFMAWEQSMTKPFPFIRVHDLEVLKELDPLTGLALGESRDGETSGEPVEFNDTTKRPYETTANDDSAPMPQTTRFYRIDGSARLRRSRFLHLELDIELREPAMATIPDPATESPAGPRVPSDAAAPTWSVHKLSQSRPVQTAKYEYFDGPNIAVLALVTRIDLLSTEEQAAQDALATGAREFQP